MNEFQPGYYVIRHLSAGRVHSIRCSTFAHAMQQCFLMNEKVTVMDKNGLILKFNPIPS